MSSCDERFHRPVQSAYEDVDLPSDDKLEFQSFSAYCATRKLCSLFCLNMFFHVFNWGTRTVECPVVQ